MGFPVGSSLKRIVKQLSPAELNFLFTSPVQILPGGFIVNPVAASLNIYDSTTGYDYTGADLRLVQDRPIFQAVVTGSSGDPFYSYIFETISAQPEGRSANSAIFLQAAFDSITPGDGIGFLYFYFYPTR